MKMAPDPFCDFLVHVAVNHSVMERPSLGDLHRRYSLPNSCEALALPVANAGRDIDPESPCLNSARIIHWWEDSKFESLRLVFRGHCFNFYKFTSQVDVRRIS